MIIEEVGGDGKVGRKEDFEFLGVLWIEMQVPWTFSFGPIVANDGVSHNGVRKLQGKERI